MTDTLANTKSQSLAYAGFVRARMAIPFSLIDLMLPGDGAFIGASRALT